MSAHVVCTLRRIGPVKGSLNALALIDTGNSLGHGGVAMSGVMAQRLGLKVFGKPLSVGTASARGKMTSSGFVKDFEICIPGLPNFRSQATVFPTLQSDINVGLQFLVKHNLQIDLSTNPIRLHLKGELKKGHKIMTLSGRGHSDKRPITVAKAVSIPAGDVTHVKVTGIPEDRHLWKFEGRSEECMHAVSGTYLELSVPVRNPGGKVKVLPVGHLLGEGRRLPTLPPTLQSVADEADSLKELFATLKLDENQLLAKHPGLLQDTKKMIARHRGVFSGPGNRFGVTDLMECDLQLKPGAKPIRQCVRRLNPDMMENLRAQLDEWLEAGLVEPCNSPWATPLHPVHKKDGRIRWTMDFRMVNAALEDDCWPLPNIEDQLQSLQGCGVFSSLDAVDAYWTLKLTPRSKPITAFICPFGLFQWTRMPFGLKNAGSVYMRFVQLALGCPRKNASIYMDDVLVHCEHPRQHLNELEKILIAHERAGLRLKASKTNLFQEKVDFLGHQVSKEGISMREDYIEKIRNWPVPKSVKELNTLLGFFNYYRQFIPNFAQYLEKANAQRRSLKLVWTDEMTRNFEKLKEEFLKSPVRAFPDFKSGQPFRLTTDFSGRGVGAILSQVQDGKERLIGAVSRSTTKFEANYPSHKGELSALMFGVRKFHHILLTRRFEVYTDASALKYLTTLKLPSGIMARWVTELQGYSFIVHHKPGKSNTNADALSRSPHLSPAPTDDYNEQNQYLHQLTRKVESVDVLDPTDRNTDLGTRETDEELHPLDRANIRKVQSTDPKCILLMRILQTEVSETSKYQSVKESKNQSVKESKRQSVKVSKSQSVKEKEDEKEVRKGWSKEMQMLFQVRKQMSINPGDGVIEYVGRTRKGARSPVPYMPAGLRKEAFKSVHSAPDAGHWGIDSTQERAHRYFFWPDMNLDIRIWVASCDICVTKKRKTDNKKCQHKPRYSGYPMQTIYVDTYGPMPLSPKGNRYLLTVEDAFTKYTQCLPMPSKDSRTVANVLVNNFLLKFGVPSEIHSDRGTEFTSALFEEMMDLLQIKHTYQPPYNPWSNPAERFHRSLGQLFRVWEGRKDWESQLPFAMCAYNTRVHSSTGVTPNCAMFGREIDLPLDLIMKPPNQKGIDAASYVGQFREELQKIFDQVARCQTRSFAKSSKLYSGEENFYKEGDQVWWFIPKPNKKLPRKLTTYWTGPYTIVKVESAVTVLLRPSGSEATPKRAHVTRLARFHGSEPLENRFPINWEELEDGEDELELINLEDTELYRGIKVWEPSSEGAMPQRLEDEFEREEEPEEKMYKSAGSTEDEGKRDRSQPVAARKIEPIRKLSAISPANEEAALAILPPFCRERFKEEIPENYGQEVTPPPPPPATVELASQREGAGGDSSIHCQLATKPPLVKGQNVVRSYSAVVLGLDRCKQRISNQSLGLQQSPTNSKLQCSQRLQQYSTGGREARMESVHKSHNPRYPRC